MTSIFVPAGQALTITSISAGSYWRVTSGAEPGAPSTFAINSSTVIGPFNDNRNYNVISDNNDATTSLATSGVFSSDDDSSMALLAPKASPTFTGTVTLPTPYKIGAVSMTSTGTELNYVAGVTSAIQTQLTTNASAISTEQSRALSAEALLMPALLPVTVYSGDGAIALIGGIANITKGSAATLTITAPTTQQNGLMIMLISTTAFNHTVTSTSLFLDGASGAPHSQLHFPSQVGGSVILMAINQLWAVLTLRGASTT